MRSSRRNAGAPRRATLHPPKVLASLAVLMAACMGGAAADLAPAASGAPRPTAASLGGFKAALAATARPSTIVQRAGSTIPSVGDRAHTVPPPATSHAAGMPASTTPARTHSAEFLAWAQRYGKLPEYCPDGSVPCAESLRREAVWRINARHIDEHNRRSGSLMKKGLTRFADMTSEEFTVNAATYKTPLLTVEGKKERMLELDAELKRGERSPQSQKERYLMRHAGDPLMSLKLATDAAAAAGERLPSQEHKGKKGATESDGIFGKMLPALGSVSTESRRHDSRRRTESTRNGRNARAAQHEPRHHSHREYANPHSIDDVSPMGTPGGGETGAMAGEGGDGPLGTNLPVHFDWSDTVDFGDVVHQGKCAGCWAYSTAAVIEAARVIDARVNGGDADATTERLSPHALIDCDDLDRGCATGNMASAYSWIQTSTKGIPTMDAYPSRGAGGVCDKAKLGAIPASKVVRTDGYCDLPSLGDQSETQLLAALAQQPVAVGVNVHALQFYESGVVDIEDCPPASDDPLKAINHAAVLTGWGRDDATGKWYWILRNTYGDQWGEDGYARLAFGQEAGTNFGTCALYTEGNYPVVGGLGCTDGAVRKEAVKHGKHVWLYPGGYNMGPRDAPWTWPTLSEMKSMLQHGGQWGEDGVAAVAVFGVMCAVVVAALVAARRGRLERVNGSSDGATGDEQEAEGLLSAGNSGAYGSSAAL